LDAFLDKACDGLRNFSWIAISQAGENNEYFAPAICWNSLEIVTGQFQCVLKRRVPFKFIELDDLRDVIRGRVVEVRQKASAFTEHGHCGDFRQRVLLGELPNERIDFVLHDSGTIGSEILLERASGKVQNDGQISNDSLASDARIESVELIFDLHFRLLLDQAGINDR